MPNLEMTKLFNEIMNTCIPNCIECSEIFVSEIQFFKIQFFKAKRNVLYHTQIGNLLIFF